MKKLLIAAMFAASLGAVGAPALAATEIVVVRKAPPPPRHEVVPQARHGYVWTPGYWNWNGHRYAWVRGKYVKARAGYHWAAPSWRERDGRWQLTRGAWQRGDRDHDGIPNRYDRHHGVGSDRGGIASRHDRRIDSDRDGVPNRLDARPDNPRRY
ncbi:YXWGXW repeat-containing protein [Massilia sp. METH4]|uniref:YXWGXW repeat-containing protein n=1 Tax=Massilia sp. METH4 TaxID=3123041 RepID=UPI0030D30200